MSSEDSITSYLSNTLNQMSPIHNSFSILQAEWSFSKHKPLLLISIWNNCKCHMPSQLTCCSSLLIESSSVFSITILLKHDPGSFLNMHLKTLDLRSPSYPNHQMHKLVFSFPILKTIFEVSWLIFSGWIKFCHRIVSHSLLLTNLKYFWVWCGHWCLLQWFLH